MVTGARCKHFFHSVITVLDLNRERVSDEIKFTFKSQEQTVIAVSFILNIYVSNRIFFCVTETYVLVTVTQ